MNCIEEAIYKRTGIPPIDNIDVYYEPDFKDKKDLLLKKVRFMLPPSEKERGEKMNIVRAAYIILDFEYKNLELKLSNIKLTERHSSTHTRQPYLLLSTPDNFSFSDGPDYVTDTLNCVQERVNLVKMVLMLDKMKQMKSEYANRVYQM